MYKIHVSNKFSLFHYSFLTKSYSLLAEFKDVYGLLEFNKKELDNPLLLSEVMQALECMEQLKHDTAEFGMNGYFTVSYNEEDNGPTYF